MVHSNTPNPAEITKEADIVIAAVGKAELVRGDWIKPGAVVIDVGINGVEVCIFLPSQLEKSSSRLCACIKVPLAVGFWYLTFHLSVDSILYLL